MNVTSTRFSEDSIRKFLLGDLSDKEQVEIEDRAFSDRQFLGQVLAVEQDLIDEYVRGEIPADRLQRFQSHFLASPERRKKVTFAKALATVLSDSAASEKLQRQDALAAPSFREVLSSFLRQLNPAGALSLAAASLALVFVSAWLVIDYIRVRSELAQLSSTQEAQTTQQRKLEEQIVTEQAHSQDLAEQLGRARQEELNRESQPEPQPSPLSTSPTVVALALLPGISRASDTQPQLRLPAGTRTVRLNVGIDPRDNYPRFRVELKNEQGKQILSQNNVASRTTRSGRTITLNAAGRLFSPGRYELALTGVTADGTAEEVGFYYFEVLPK